MTKRDLYQHITNHIAEAIEEGAQSFEMPWHRGGITQARPANALTGRGYQGINVLALWVAAQRNGFSSGYWGTYNQWSNLGTQVRKGEKSSVIVFYKHIEREVEEEDAGENETKRLLYARSYSVFNADQVDGWTPPQADEESHVNGIMRAATFIGRTCARIAHGGDRAYYDPRGDCIHMPDAWRFKETKTSSATENYYGTLLHEITHWTGHAERLGRDFTGRFGEQSYAMEELVAEIGAAFLCADLGVSNTPRQDHAAYVSAWLEVLNRDKKAVFTAASKAQQAAEYLVALQTAVEKQAAIVQ